MCEGCVLQVCVLLCAASLLLIGIGRYSGYILYSGVLIGLTLHG